MVHPSLEGTLFTITKRGSIKILKISTINGVHELSIHECLNAKSNSKFSEYT